MTTIEPVEALREQLEEAYRRWQVAWSDFGYNSPQEREAFERIEELGLRLAEASANDYREWTKRIVADCLAGVRQDLDVRVEPANRDLDEMQRVTGDVQQRIDRLQKALNYG